MKKVSHEVPLCMLDYSRSFNDFDYALVHLFEQHPSYYEFFKNSLLMGREVILDNSVFELGKPFDSTRYLNYIKDLKPTYAIIPDKFEDFTFTVNEATKWSNLIKDLGVKAIGVLQGKTLFEFEECYKRLDGVVDRIAISFAQPLFERLYTQENKDYARMYGRIYLINYLLEKGVINKSKKHHLLGLSLPQEMMSYRDESYSFIDSVDSSSPIVHGLKGMCYTRLGLASKDPTKLVDLFNTSDHEVHSKIEIINHNINLFRTYL